MTFQADFAVSSMYQPGQPPSTRFIKGHIVSSQGSTASQGGNTHGESVCRVIGARKKHEVIVLGSPMHCMGGWV
eukprot:407557-Pelagomonas_calceolata.AAC.7